MSAAAEIPQSCWPTVVHEATTVVQGARADHLAPVFGARDLDEISAPRVRARHSDLLAAEERGLTTIEQVLHLPRNSYGAAVISPVPRPLLFLDVDGPLIPFGANPEQLPGGYPIYQTGSDLGEADTNPLLARIDPALGPCLAALPYDLVWATTWMADANECIAPRLGLPQLPVLDWPDEPDEPDDDESGGLHWKTRPLLAWAAGRPFAWVDDEITDADRAWAASHRTGPCLLWQIDPTLGLQPDDFTTLRAWAAALVPR